ncbi:MAG: hypothetical protein Q7R45_12920 [Sulfuricaulis sp.]|nr:hypothetical protein [Sulfuricaulis sp.]
MAIISTRPVIGLIKTRWRNRKAPRTLEDRAGVIGANIWKIALDVYKHLEKDGFRFGSDQQVTAVITEFIAFLVQLTDRAVHGRRNDTDRASLINAVAGHLAKTMENNQLDLLGPGDYRKPFIQTLNDRFEDYARFEYIGRDPGYACLCYFGGKVSDAMASSDNKWVLEQMMEVETPEMVRCIKKLVDEVVEEDASRTADRQ